MTRKPRKNKAACPQGLRSECSEGLEKGHSQQGCNYTLKDRWTLKNRGNESIYREERQTCLCVRGNPGDGRWQGMNSEWSNLARIICGGPVGQMTRSLSFFCENE